ncbi:hypothetical protein LguiA_024965 [Lonicera macranthoides]
MNIIGTMALDTRGVVRNPKTERTNRTDPLRSEISRTEKKSKPKPKPIDLGRYGLEIRGPRIGPKKPNL